MMYYRRRWRSAENVPLLGLYFLEPNTSFEAYMKELDRELYWDSAYAIALALIDHFPYVNPEDVGLVELSEMVVDLPGFKDDSSLVTERMLLDIQSSWYEELNS